MSTIEEVSFLTNITHKFNDNWSIAGQYMIMQYSGTGSSLWAYSMAENGDLLRYLSIWDALSTNQLAQIYVNGTFRITSYNVCYTKLLRLHSSSPL